ncbi:MAG: NAD-dependent epimerase/dehydratase family protein [Tomitella sp.]|nr:NAD-dependent epimerase/dehydratase family protein [Tomitella sp.]
MRVAVTGGTGYLGAHTVRALLEAGHEAKLLVTPNETDAPVLDRLRALGPVTVTVGDIRDAPTVADFLTGTEALFHAAGVVGTDERHTQLMWEVNAYATESILTTAVQTGLAPVVSVNSYSALFPAPDGVISPDTPTAPGRSSYAKTKGYADGVARRLQADGAPVVVTYPSSVVGPAFHTAPGVTERGWGPIARWAVAPSVRGGMQMVDVRDVTEAHLRVLEKVREPRRYVCGGVLLSFDEMVDALEEGVGRKVRRISIPPAVFRGMGRLSDVAGRYVAIADGLSYEAALLLTAATPTDDSATVRDLGITWRHPRAAIVDSVRS